MRERVARAITPVESWWIWRDVGLEKIPLKAREKLLADSVITFNRETGRYEHA